MKTFLKILGGFLAGAVAGLLLAGAGGVLFGGMSCSEFLGALSALGWAEALGIALLSIVLFFVCMVLHVALHEAGHLVCGLATGYRFVSFRIFSLTLVRQDGCLRLKRYRLAGTGGQCLLEPSEGNDGRIPVFWYNAGGVLANLLVSAVALFLWLLPGEQPLPLSLFLLLLALSGFFLAVLNGFPMKVGGMPNDAYNIRLLRNSVDNRRLMRLQLRVAARVLAGLRPGELPGEWFFHLKEVDYANPFQVASALLDVSWLEDVGEWEEAYARLEAAYVHRHELPEVFGLEVCSELLFTALATGRGQQADQLLTPRLRRYLEQYKAVGSTRQRVLFAIALCLEHDEARARDILRIVEAQSDRYLMQGEVAMDVALMHEMLARQSPDKA